MIFNTILNEPATASRDSWLRKLIGSTKHENVKQT